MASRADDPNLDLIRAVAVLSVFVGHLIGRSAWHIAQMGVIIFFVHTSLVLMRSLDRSRLDGRARLADFYIRRAFRIYPLSMACVTCSFLFLGPWTWSQYLSNMALTMNLTFSEDMWGGLWTLPLEIQMYVVLPFLFALLRAAPIWSVIAIWGLAVVLGIAQPIAPGMSRLSVLAFAPCFLGGVIAWRLSRAYAPRVSGAWWPLAFVATFPIFLLATREHHLYYRWAFCLALGLTIPWFGEMRWRGLTWPAKVIAKYSYGIYLSHVIIIVTVFDFGLSPLPSWLLLLGAAIVLPLAMYHLIEDPMIRVGRRVAGHLTARGVRETGTIARTASVSTELRAPLPDERPTP